jgi:hypothetical protein
MENWPHAQFDHLTSERVDLCIPKYARRLARVALIPPVELFETASDAGVTRAHGSKRIQIRQGIALECETRAGEKQIPLLREVGIVSVPLDARALGNLRNRRTRRPKSGVQIEGRFDDPQPRLCLLFRSPSHTVVALFRCTNVCT